MNDPTTHETGGHGPPHPHHHPAVTILVNNHAVKLPDKEATGFEIKEAAIKQGVPIQLGFVPRLSILHTSDEHHGQIERHGEYLFG